MRLRRGFTLIELLVALAVIAVLASLALPSLQRLNGTMRYREAVRTLVTAANTARRDAFAEGRAFDLLVLEDAAAWTLVPADRAANVLRGDIAVKRLPEELDIKVTYASEVSPGRGIASIRFYPGGGSSGGDIDVLRPRGSGTRIKIDWLLGEVQQVPVQPL